MVRLQRKILNENEKETLSLNSTMVRLQLLTDEEYQEMTHLSQFHYGSITTKVNGIA